jgi:dCMP deaminase
MDSAKLSANMSHCNRAKVGSVLVKDNRIVSNGWNGTVSGMDNCCEESDESGNLVTSKFVVHAEANCILFAAKSGISTNGCSLYVTLSPCSECAKLIAQAGIKKVYYNEAYRDQSGVDYLKSFGVVVEKIH